MVVTDAEPDRLTPLAPPAPLGLRRRWQCDLRGRHRQAGQVPRHDDRDRRRPELADRECAVSTSGSSSSTA